MLVLYIITVLLALGAIYSHLKLRTFLWGKPLTGVLAISAMMLTIINIVASIKIPARNRDALVDRELEYNKIAMKYLGNYLATNYGGGKILLITKADDKSDVIDDELMLDILREGLAGRATIAAQVSPTAFDPDNPADTEKQIDHDSAFTAKFFDAAYKRHRECHVILSLIGLPSDWKQMEIWSMESGKRPRIVVANANIYDLKYPIKWGYISAVTTYNRDYEYDLKEKVPEDLYAAFNRRYVLINRQNLDQFIYQHPDLFSDVEFHISEDVKE